tara:strand:+ start:282 stop:503 length:222 start_codon:yes stop_codon:yes gene_type:complete
MKSNPFGMRVPSKKKLPTRLVVKRYLKEWNFDKPEKGSKEEFFQKKKQKEHEELLDLEEKGKKILKELKETNK